MLRRMRTVPWQGAVLLFGAGAASAILLASMLDADGGSSAREKAGAKRAAAGEKPGMGGKERARAGTRAKAGSSPEASIATMVGQRFMVGLRGTAPTEALLADARKGEIGGILIFPEGATPRATAAAIAALQGAASDGGNPPLLIAIDQEGGPVKRFSAEPPDAPLSELSPAEAQREGTRTGERLKAIGINVDLAPVVDLGLPGSFITRQGRAISSDHAEVSLVAHLFATGLDDQGVMPVAKHFPGLGSASQNTDEGRSVVEAEIDESLLPFAAWAERGLPAIMVASATYTAIDGENGAAWSSEIVRGLLRKRLGFRGLVLSDDLSTPGVTATLPVPTAATASAAAGVDVLMIAEPESFRPAYEAALQAAREDRIPAAGLRASYRRILKAKDEYAR